MATFGTKTTDLLALRDWLQSLGVTHVAMEATGVYWKPVYYMLEDGLQVLLVNPREVQQVPGRKTDSSDAAWIAQLLECGLLRGSFIPPREIRELRDLTRYRKALTGERTSEVLRLHAVLQDAGIKLSSVATNILGVSGRAMIELLVSGQNDPEILAELARGQLRKKVPLLKKALEGHFRSHHGFLITEMLQHIDELEERLEAVGQQIEKHLVPFAEDRARLMSIPGIQERVSASTLAEIGVNMAVFPSADHLSSWAGLCPGNRQSGGKRKVQHVRKGDRYLKAALVEAAWAAVKKKDNYLAAQYHRIVPRRGKKRAIVAVAHSMLVIAYHLLKEKKVYSDLGPDYFLQLNREAIEKRCVRQLRQLGYDVTLAPAA